jgi:myosin-5
MTELTVLNEPAIGQNLVTRYNVEKIYTFTGPVLTAMNPYFRYTSLYTKECMKGLLSQLSHSTHVCSCRV